MNKKVSFNMVFDMLKLTFHLDKFIIMYMIMLAIVNSVKPYIAIFLSTRIIDGLIEKNSTHDLFVITVIGVTAIFLVQLLVNIIKKYTDIHVQICCENYHMKQIKKTLKMDYEQLESPISSDIKARIINDNNWSNGFSEVLYSFQAICENILSIIAAIIVLLPFIISGNLFSNFTTPIYAVVFIAIIISSVLFRIQYLDKKELALFDENIKNRKYASFFTWGGIDYKSGKDIRIYDAASAIKKYVAKGDFERNSWIKRVSYNNGLSGFIYGLSAGMLQGGIYLFVISRAVAGTISVGSVVKCTATIINFISKITELLNSIANLLIAVKRQQSTLEYLNIPDVLHKGSIPIKCQDDYEIEFKNVSFKYPESEKYSLRNLSMKLHAGKRTAVVGTNGSGKTTMIKLLCRFYDPTEGEITINGIDIKNLDYKEYINIFSIVFQDFKLFSFQLGQNVSTSVNVYESKANHCLHMAGLGERMKGMRKGLETPLYKDFEEDGVEVSGGEAQKIAIARALYKDTPFIILDEPTAALDPIAEYEIYSKFNEIAEDRSTIYISHRLSSCRFCDDIVVLHEGEMIQRGNHDTLLKEENGKYYELWNAQAQYYL
jgi:ATP-binding cassette subfamily B protein